MKMYKLSPRAFASNCYLLTADGAHAVAIDPGEESMVDRAKQMGLTISAVLLTHGHFDHIGACNHLAADGVPVYCSEAERSLLLGEGSLCRQYGAPMPVFKPISNLKDGDKIELCGVTVKVIATPGHTAGGLSYLVRKALFTGDTLFREGIGRTDFPTGDRATIENSVKKLYALIEDADVYPGHGENTTLARERNHNPFVRG